MKTLLFLMMLDICVAQPVLAQDEIPTADEVLFKEAAELFENDNYHEAAQAFQKMRVQFPQSTLIGRAHFNEALSYYLQQHYETAKKTFSEILDQPYNEQDENNLMEPYTLYKHHSARYLAQIALEEKDYNRAEEYIHIFDKEYPYQHFCGNEWAAYDMYKAVMYAKVYAGTNRVKKSIEQLLPHIFNNGLASNGDILSELTLILEKNFSREQIKDEFTRALNSLEIKETKKDTSAIIRLYGVKIGVYDYSFESTSGENDSGKERYSKMIKQNELFKKFL